MKKLTVSIIVTGLLAGSLFANGSHTMDNSHSKMMNQENCSAMHKEFHKTSKIQSNQGVSQNALDAFYPAEGME